MNLKEKHVAADRIVDRVPRFLALTMVALWLAGCSGMKPRDIVSIVEPMVVDPGVNVAGLQMASDQRGNAFAVWDQKKEKHADAVFNRYERGQGWSGSSLLEHDDAGNAVLPQLAVNGKGDMLAVWSQSDGARFNILANRYAADTSEIDGKSVYTRQGATQKSQALGLGKAEMIENLDTGHASEPAVSIDDKAGGIAIWQYHEGAQWHVYANRYDDGWKEAERLDTADIAHSPWSAANGTGQAVAVWKERGKDASSGKTLESIHVTRYADRWLPPRQVSGAVIDIYCPRVVIDKNGNALAAWAQQVTQEGRTGYRMVVSHSDAQKPWVGQWSRPMVLGEEGKPDAPALSDLTAPVCPELVMAEADIQAGDQNSAPAFVIWVQAHQLWAARMEPGQDTDEGQIRVQKVASNPGGVLRAPVAVTANDGRVVVIWRQSEGTEVGFWYSVSDANELAFDKPVRLEKIAAGGSTVEDPRFTVLGDDILLIWPQLIGEHWQLVSKRYADILE